MLTDQEFTKAFQKAADSGSYLEANNFFNRREFSYLCSLQLGNYCACVQQGLELLERCRSIDPTRYDRMHKGYPFFWTGIAAFLAEDYEKGLHLIDAAVLEDQKLERACPKALEDALALRFIRLECGDVNQNVDALAERAKKEIDDLTITYNKTKGCVAKNLNFEHIKRHVLTEAKLRTIATALISFVLEWRDRKSLRALTPCDATAEPFFLHLFKGCLICESLLKILASNIRRPTFGTILNEIGQCNLHLCRIVNVSADSLDDVLQNICAHFSITDAIEATGKLRNTLGHDLGWAVTLDREKYDLAVRIIGVSCLHAIACLDKDHRATSQP